MNEWGVFQAGTLEHSIVCDVPKPYVVGFWSDDEGDFRGFIEMDKNKADIYALVLNGIETVSYTHLTLPTKA